MAPTLDPMQDATNRVASAHSGIKDAQRRLAIAVAELESALLYLKQVSK